MFRKVFVFSISSLLFLGCGNPFESDLKDVNSNVTPTIRPGSNYNYFIDQKYASPVVVRAVCTDPDSEPSRYTCNQSREKVGLLTFVKQYSKELVEEVKVRNERLSNTLLTANALTTISKADKVKIEDSNLLKNTLDQAVESSKKDLNVLLKMEKSYPELIKLLVQMSNKEVVVYNAKTFREKVKGATFGIVRKLEMKFDAALKERGYQCAGSTSGFKTEGGGCKDSNKLVWSGALGYGSNKSGFITRMDALIKCGNLTLGNKFDWRVPTEKELLSLGRKASVLGLSPSLYYWSADQVESRMIDPVTKKLAPIFKENGTETVVVGHDVYSHTVDNPNQQGGTYRSFDSIPVLDSAVRIRAEIERTLKAKISLKVSREKLVNPFAQKVDFAFRYSYIDSKGIYSSVLQNRLEVPIYDRERYSVSAPARWGASTLGSWYSPAYKYISSTLKKRGNATSTRIVGYKSTAKSVNPFSFIDYHVPKQAHQQIGLVCVREGK